MRSDRLLWSTFVGVALSAGPAFAQPQFGCGSSGASGPLVVPVNQTVVLDLPDDGIFHFTTVTVSGRLEFKRNARFNPPAMLLATGDLVVNNSGSIRVTGSPGSGFVGGLAGPGGFDGGAPGIAGGEPGAGHGPGAGKAGIGALPGGNAGYGGSPTNTATTNGTVYGSPLLVPLVGGSGGGGDTNQGGSGGGGALLLCSPTQIVLNGNLDAQGGSGQQTNGGSGGAVRLVSPAVRGAGSIYVTAYWQAGHGRIRIDTIDRSGLSFFMNPTSAVSVGSFMSVFPSTVPRLDIVHVAGNDIPQGTSGPVALVLPFNAPATQAITVRATGFSGTVPIAVVITPDAGAQTVVNAEINGDASPAETTVNVDFPQNVTVRVHAWTR
jgi:hypothetical protein